MSRNTGTVAGKEIVQVYVRDVAARVARPDKELKAFAKVTLDPGATTTVALELDRAAFAFWDDARHAWAVEAGDFEIVIGSSSVDIRATVPLKVTGSTFWGGPPYEAQRLSVDSTVRELLADEAAAAVIEKHLPGFAATSGSGMTAGMTLTQIRALAPDQITDDILRRITADLDS